MSIPPTVDWASRSFALALSLILGQACIDGPAEPPRARDTDTDVPGFYDLGESQLMLELARKIPGFGGLYYEPGGDRLVIALTEPNRAGFPAARQIVSVGLAVDIGLPLRAVVRSVEFVERVVEHSFIELARHRARLRPRLFAIPEVVSLDVDEEANRISIGVQNVSARDVVLDVLTQMVVPLKTISFRLESPAQVAEGLVDETHLSTSGHRLTDSITIPDGMLRGGYQVTAEERGGCSLGFTAVLKNRSATGVFVSSSHCSTDIFELDRADVGQPDTLNVVGLEMRDPDPHDCSS